MITVTVTVPPVYGILLLTVTDGSRCLTFPLAVAHAYLTNAAAAEVLRALPGPDRRMAGNAPVPGGLRRLLGPRRRTACADSAGSRRHGLLRGSRLGRGGTDDRRRRRGPRPGPPDRPVRAAARALGGRCRPRVDARRTG